MREKSTHNEHTFALTAHFAEAQRQVPIAPCDWWSDVRCSQWVLLVWRRLLTTGLVSHRHMAATHNTVRAAPQGSGTCWSRTTSSLKRVDLNIVSLWSFSSSCALSVSHQLEISARRAEWLEGEHSEHDDVRRKHRKNHVRGRTRP